MTGQHAQPPDGCRFAQTRGMAPPLMAFELVERSAAQFCGTGEAPGRFRRAVHKLRLEELHEREEEVAGVSVSISCVWLYTTSTFEVVERRTLAWPVLVRWSPAPFLAWVRFGPRASRSIRRARCRARAVVPPVVKGITKSQSPMPVWRSTPSISG